MIDDLHGPEFHGPPYPHESVGAYIAGEESKLAEDLERELELRRVLDCPMGSSPTDAGTVRQYLVDILHVIWDDSPKRIFGESDWQFHVYEALIRGNLVDGVIDPDGYVDELDEPAADALVLDSIKLLGKS